jgi:2-polyprenyl-3-methyl-5-hydroxy-6-metoxy-1,4-benzoquinol methylase
MSAIFFRRQQFTAKCRLLDLVFSLLLVATLVFCCNKQSAMAWRSSGRTHLELISNLYNNGVIKSEIVKKAMEKVDRRFFAPHDPYDDSPQPIGYGATISAPHMHAFALEIMKDKLVEGAKVLDVGSGTGYLTPALLKWSASQAK